MVHIDMTEEEKGHEDTETLVVKRKGGGDIIENRPVFSGDAKTLFITTSYIVRAYNVLTGEIVQEFDKLESKVIGVELHPSNPDILVACSEEGQLIEYYWKTGRHVKEVKLQLERLGGPTKSKVHGFHLVPTWSKTGTTSYNVFLWIKQQHTPKVPSKSLKPIICVGHSGMVSTSLTRTLGPFMSAGKHKHSFAFGNCPDKEFVASVDENAFYAYSHAEQMVKKHLIGGGRIFTCVSCHPSEEVVATGDNSGRVLIWHNFLNRPPAQSRYHWHTLPVEDIAFSHAGSFFYSGGEEGVLVKWNLNDEHNKSFLPRLPATICHLVVSPDNTFVAVSTLDNGIQLIDPHRRINSVIQHLTWGTIKGKGKSLFPAGIIVDPRTKAIVLNGRCGHIQFYCPNATSLLYNLDITNQNIVTRQRNETVVNTEVVRTAISGDGLWLATVEERNDAQSSLESRLKFWQYDLTRRIYTLNTSIEKPHSGSVTAIKFQPISTLGPLMLVTVGEDCKYRSWCLVSANSIYKSGQVWQCESVGFFKDLPVGDVGFSSDGSLLAVTFATTLTVWVPETSELKCSLTHIAVAEPLNRVEFGQKNLNHLVIVASKVCVAAWNLLSLSLLWVADVSVALLASDPILGNMAIFTSSNKLIVISPDSHKPLYEQKSISPNKCPILAAVFVPRLNPCPSHVAGWLAHSQLFYIDSQQELLTIDSNKSDQYDGLAVLPAPENIPLTPFAALMAQQRSTDVELLTPTPHFQMGIPGAATVKEFLSAPAHTMPSLTLLCGAFLQSFIATSTSPKEEERVQPELMDVDTDEESDNKESAMVKMPQTSQSLVEHEDGTGFDLDKQLDSLLNESMKWTEKLVTKET